MTKIPSTEKTEDFIYRLEVKKSGQPHRNDAQRLLIFEQHIGPTGTFHSMDVSILRDGQRDNDIEFRSFEHLREPNITYIKLIFDDKMHHIADHDYLLTLILRYFI